MRAPIFPPFPLPFYPKPTCHTLGVPRRLPPPGRAVHCSPHCSRSSGLSFPSPHAIVPGYPPHHSRPAQNFPSNPKGVSPSLSRSILQNPPNQSLSPPHFPVPAFLLAKSPPRLLTPPSPHRTIAISFFPGPSQSQSRPLLVRLLTGPPHPPEPAKSTPSPRFPAFFLTRPSTRPLFPPDPPTPDPTAPPISTPPFLT